ncbi:peptidase M48 Ste24p [Natrinema pellirubrum DSM 15624]|uniref:Peptidase M48 Ste24p n=1 Tax=Natrinema pellirubrum (strain DSM 15624 / CIP 106293 / JCM 10476 / NCIMB 786 / 157) TaxID=797303 RepID=L0JPQ3_NATP1|nr:M48 family metalloprotease [Natrinema pellirubrum]AGB32808.1 Zn-dependent protease with chaperone function [Natrinema pellirubrum DSM 15624]ELY75570.1 peptidase M48 Ste24p [Natrinema pellirubrum DSM 15624]
MFVAAAFLIGLAVVPFLVFRAYATRVEASDEPIEDRLHRLNRAQQVGGFTLPVAAIIELYALELSERALAAVGASGPEIAGLAVLEFGAIVLVSFGVVTLPLVGMALGTYPTVRSLRDTSASLWRVVKGILAVMGITAVSVGVALAGFFAIQSVFGSSLPVLIGGLGTVIFVGFGLSPYLIVIFQDRVPLEDQRRERVDRLCADLGYRPRGLFLLEGESTKTANALVAGTVPGLRYVFLTDYLLAECDDDELCAILAHEFGHVAGRHLWQRGLLTVAVFGAWIAGAEFVGFGALEEALGFLGFFLPFMGLYAVYHVVLLGGLARWQEFRADAYAARRVGHEAMVAALERLADANDTRREAGLLYSLATHHPPISDRIEAVRDWIEATGDARGSETPSGG